MGAIVSGTAGRKQVVHLPARLRGMGRVAGCILEVWDERSSSGRMYTRCRITNDPPNFPDGLYYVDFAGHMILTRRWGGLWDITFLPPDLQSDDAA